MSDLENVKCKMKRLEIACISRNIACGGSNRFPVDKECECINILEESRDVWDKVSDLLICCCWQPREQEIVITKLKTGWGVVTTKLAMSRCVRIQGEVRQHHTTRTHMWARIYERTPHTQNKVDSNVNHTGTSYAYQKITPSTEEQWSLKQISNVVSWRVVQIPY